MNTSTYEQIRGRLVYDAATSTKHVIELLKFFSDDDLIKIQVAAQEVAEAIKRIHNEDSVSSLFV